MSVFFPEMWESILPKESDFLNVQNKPRRPNTKRNKQQESKTRKQIRSKFLPLASYTKAGSCLQMFPFRRQTTQVFCIWSLLQTLATGQDGEWEKCFLSNLPPIKGFQQGTGWSFSKKQGGLYSFPFPSFPTSSALLQKMQGATLFLFEAVMEKI